MKNLKFLYIVIISVLGLQVQAQQDPHFSLYKFNMNAVNPAYAGTNGSLEGIFSVRSQWTGTPDAPETFNFNVNSPVGKKVGLGLSVIADNVYVLNETHVYADFSYKIPLSETTNLFAGVKAGGSFLNINLSETGVQNDPLFTGDVSEFNPNVGVGFYLKATKYYITASAPGLLSNDRFEKEASNPVEASDELHMFLGGGYEFVFNENFAFKPSTMLRAVAGAPLSVDVTGAVAFKERLELGGNYRLDESFTVFLTAGFIDNALTFGYAYENATTDVSNYNNGSHEVVLKFRLN
ncbi:type IX secretion system membrane protein PorP/SprF [Aquimarina sp. 2-A2]|uniref:PorP/SprF family type IX secretion system membrane protein n=1 Tax=Aquimarina sp. 2-A2 TaxID=3382644 RepID=UPI00387F17F4